MKHYAAVDQNKQIRAGDRTKLVEALLAHFPPGQFAKYLAAGMVNTIFGYGSFALLNKIFTPHISHAYILIGPVANLINITFSLLNYKWFIFKTKGNYAREWLRCASVSSGGIILGTVSLPTLVFMIRHMTRLNEAAPYIAWAILLATSVVMGFVGHRRFTFAQATPIGGKGSETEM